MELILLRCPKLFKEGKWEREREKKREREKGEKGEGEKGEGRGRGGGGGRLMKEKVLGIGMRG